MSLSRREFMQMLALAGAAGLGLPGCASDKAAKGYSQRGEIY